ncbi:alpha-crystallin B chain-like [Littorina saxatilis]|uniref:SHSP domain-containing protein n=1 Tax=Littorina saxatilis TaxID=31220 RepID=A0AAN9BTD5_9CAEN
MALTPFLRGFWEHPWEGQNGPSRLYDQHFGNIVADDLFRHPFAMRQYDQRLPQQTGKSEVVNTDSEFRVNVDVQQFKPEEINVKTKDNRLVVNARHEERPDEHGFIMREFTRQYVLPKDVDPNQVTSSLSKEGVLTLKAPKKALEAPDERKIPITHEKGDA